MAIDFYLTESGGKRLHFPLNPERITVGTNARIQTYESLSLGEYALPRGSMLSRVMLDGIFPGKLRRNASFIKSWQDPRELSSVLAGWRDGGIKLRLLVTETVINFDVYVQSFEHTWSGGHGDMRFTLELVQARDIIVPTVNKANSTASSRPIPASSKTHTVVKGDTLWGIAKRYLQNGARHKEIYNLNKSLIGPDPNKIKPGQVLRLPG
ncbi:LysM peptidoglycan-binding domain-containing protein [Paenibacillus sp. NPDC057967]|uniref:LysM peptidoglycan-binding domain-containing protein n=1 Tax=Paenibacillus sp. NPDC057967 TaxID=3346293 RepID=UPI0036DCBB51